MREQELDEAEDRVAAEEEQERLRALNGQPPQPEMIPADQDQDPHEHAGANAADGDELRKFRRAAWVQIAASLEVMATHGRAQYRGLNLVPAVVPLVVSSGGALHRDMARFLKDMLPDPEARKQLRIDMSLALLRGRASTYDLTLDRI